MAAMEGAYIVFFDSDTLLVLTLEGIAEESDCKIQGRCEHTVSEKRHVCMTLRGVKQRETHCDSVRKTGIVFDSVKFCDWSKIWKRANSSSGYLQKEPIFEAHGDTKIDYRT